jgi:O-antigen ligase
MFVHKIHVIVFGGGAQAASNEARGNQFKMALPALLHNPIGHGAGQSGVAMGYGAGDFIAIDSYYISVALDYGVLGVALYVAIFGLVIGAAVTTMLRSAQTDDREIGLLLPLATCLSAFLVIRGVFEQPDIHPMIFMMVGMVIALVARARAQTDKQPGAGPAKTNGKRPRAARISA